MRSAIYRGAVVHTRLSPRRHRLRYSVFSMLFDLDELDDLDRRFIPFGYNRAAPLAFYDTDHGPTDGTPLRPWVEARMREAGVTPDGGAIRLLCFPRILGYVFNPLSVYYCYRRDESIAAVLYEVCNTFGERHTYVMAAGRDNDPVLRQAADKCFYVSPFIDMQARYHFRIAPPEDNVNIAIREDDRHGPILAATFRGERVPLNARALWAALGGFPLQSLKVIVGNQLEALKIWTKGFKIKRHPAPPHRVASTRSMACRLAAPKASTLVKSRQSHSSAI
ncbi:MAG: DUF1365 domain-containing protein [Pseudomonadota bacterium]|nr:DUF1365 domain-containing protein [Pseudomonadota bacterium]